MAVLCLQVNGVRHELQADPDAMLIDVLREDLGLKGTRFGCGETLCGACLVLVDGRTRPACDTPAASVQGQSVVTMEGIVPPSLGDALRAAFVAEQALQCGFCSSGMLVAAAALIAREPDPGEAQVREALENNLCRCGAHNRIVRAVRRAARSVREAT